MTRVWRAIAWQLRAVLHEIRTAAVFYLILNALLLLLPLPACRFIDQKAGMLVMLVSICYAFSLFMALLYSMGHMLEKPGSLQNELWHLAEPNPWIRIFSRLTAVSALIAVSFLNGQAGTVLMRKFADETHFYFRMEMRSGIPETFIQFALLLPLLYLFRSRFFKWEQSGKSKALPLIATLIAGQILNNVLLGMPSMAGTVAAAALLSFLFWQSGRLEELRDVV